MAEFPIICAEERCVKLYSEFEPLQYAAAFDEKGRAVKLRVVASTVDTSKQGVYSVLYSAEGEGFMTSKKVNVKVVEYLPENQAFSDFMESIALEQYAVAAILSSVGLRNKESEQEYANFVRSVKNVMESAVQLETQISNKLETALRLKNLSQYQSRKIV